MKCYARWTACPRDGVFFRDQTLLQFGDDWNVVASFVLLNPGSAKPLDQRSQTRFLRARLLPFFVPPGENQEYYRFSIDRLMNDLLNLFKAVYDGGVIRIFNLFNLRNQHSSKAVQQLLKYQKDPSMFTHRREIDYCSRPVVIATGKHAFRHSSLTKELLKYISLAEDGALYTLSKIGGRKYGFTQVRPQRDGLVNSFHPSFTCKYGNTTIFEGFE
jgi:hypothetical protein